MSASSPRLTVCLTLDFDGPASWIHEYGSHRLTAISRGEYGATVLPRILALLESHGVPATFFVPGTTALTYPALTERIVGSGHEIGHHGWAHESPYKLPPDEQRRVLELGSDALQQVTGARPVGYRSPSWELTPDTLALLIEQDFVYDSSAMAGDFTPYRLRRGDKWSPDAPAIFGEPTNLIELPVAWTLDDAPLFEFVPGVSPGLATAAGIRESWQDEFSFAYEEVPQGVFTLTLHPHVIGRGPRLRMLDELVGWISGHDDVAFATAADAAARFRSGQSA